MWGVVTQLPVRALSLGARLWGLYLHLLSVGLWAPLFCLLLLLRVLSMCAQEAGKAVLTAAASVAVWVQVCGGYLVLHGLAWTAQLVGSWVALHVWLCCALLETLGRILSILPCEQAVGWLVRAGVLAGRGLARVRGVATLVQVCAHTLFLGVYLCLHVCFAAISSKVHVRVHAPLWVSLPFRVHIPLSLGFRVRLQAQRHGEAEGTGGASRGEQSPPMSLEPTRRREASRSRGELCPGGYLKGLLSTSWSCPQPRVPGHTWSPLLLFKRRRTFSTLASSSLCCHLSPFPSGLPGPPSWTAWSPGKAQAEDLGRVQALPSVRRAQNCSGQCWAGGPSPPLPFLLCRPPPSLRLSVPPVAPCPSHLCPSLGESEKEKVIVT